MLTDLDASRRDINQRDLRLGPFSQAAIPAVESLGEASKAGTPAVVAARPVIADLRKLAKAVRPVGVTLRQVLESFQRTHVDLILGGGAAHWFPGGCPMPTAISANDLALGVGTKGDLVTRAMELGYEFVSDAAGLRRSLTTRLWEQEARFLDSSRLRNSLSNRLKGFSDL